MATLNPKVQAWKDKWDKEFSDLQTKHRAAEQADWEANQSTYKAQGYHREEDPNNYWGSKWSYKGNSNNGGDNGGTNDGNENKGDLSDLGLGTGTGNANGNLNFSMQNLSTIGDRTNLTHDPYFGLANKGSNPLTGTGITRETVADNVNTEETPFKYQKGKDSYYSGASAEEDFSKIFRTVHNRNYEASEVEDRKEFNNWIKHYYTDNGFNLFGNRYTISNPEHEAYIKRMQQWKLNNPSPNVNSPQFDAWQKAYEEQKANNFVGINKQGGTMNKVKYFSQGGAPTQTTQNQMSPEQELKAAVAFLRDVYAGKEKAVTSFQQIQAAAKKGVPEAKRMMELLVQASKMMQSAKWGSKLEYIRSLKFAKGGKSCPVCEQQRVEMKKCGGKKAKKRYFGGYL